MSKKLQFLVVLSGMISLYSSDEKSFVRSKRCVNFEFDEMGEQTSCEQLSLSESLMLSPIQNEDDSHIGLDLDEDCQELCSFFASMCTSPASSPYTDGRKSSLSLEIPCSMLKPAVRLDFCTSALSACSLPSTCSTTTFESVSGQLVDDKNIDIMETEALNDYIHGHLPYKSSVQPGNKRKNVPVIKKSIKLSRPHQVTVVHTIGNKRKGDTD